MARLDRWPLSAIRNPEYTGSNRCIPCTVVNVAIAGGLSIAAWMVLPGAGAVVFIGALLVIALRGYLVPGTPWLTKRYLPEWVLARFETDAVDTRDGWDATPDTATKDESNADDTSSEDTTFETVERIEHQRENAVDPVTFLLEAEVVEPTDGPEELMFTDSFAAALHERVSELDPDAVDQAVLAGLFGVDVEAIDVKDRSYPAVTVARRVRKWPGEGAYLADIAGHQTLTEVADHWTAVPPEQRLAILQSLRSFHERCPLCDGPVDITETLVESCCRAHEIIAIRCADCAEHLLELDPDEVTTPGADTGITP